MYAFYFLAGMCGLTYEVVWSRILGAWLGSADVANAVVLGTFMGGLALGARMLGPWADRIGNPLRAYGGLETGIGLYAVLSPWLFSAASALGTGAAVTPLRVGAGMLALLPPTVLMGGAFPLLTRYLTSRTVDLRRNVGHLYAVNTAGSVLGGLLAGFVLLRASTPEAALHLMGLLNLMLGAYVLSASGRAPARMPEDAAHGVDGPGLADAVTYGPGARQLSLVLAAFSGVASMALEVAWTRALADTLGDSTLGLTLMLAAFLSGSALGALLLASRRAGRWALPELLGGALLTTSVLLLASRQLQGALAAAGARDTLSYAASFGVLLLPTIAAGVIFPGAVRLGTDANHVGGRVGHIYAVNTLGTLLGAALAGLVVLPRWGFDVVFIGAAIAYALAGLAVTRFGARVRSTAARLLAGPVLSLPVTETTPREDEVG